MSSSAAVVTFLKRSSSSTIIISAFIPSVMVVSATVVRGVGMEALKGRCCSSVKDTEGLVVRRPEVEVVVTSGVKKALEVVVGE